MSKAHDQFYQNFCSQEIITKDNCIYVGDENIVHLGQSEIMATYAQATCPQPGLRLLEIGYGGGIFAREARLRDPSEHVIIECHPKIYAELDAWAMENPRVTPILGIWQDWISQIGKFDGIFYDVTCPPGEAVTDLLKIIEAAGEYLLKPGGVFSFWYCTQSIDHRVNLHLQRYFSQVKYSLYAFEPPPNWPFKHANFIVTEAFA